MSTPNKKAARLGRLSCSCAAFRPSIPDASTLYARPVDAGKRNYALWAAVAGAIAGAIALLLLGVGVVVLVLPRAAPADATLPEATASSPPPAARPTRTPVAAVPPAPSPASPLPPAPPVAVEPPPPVCPAGQVNIIYSKMHLDSTAWTAGVVRNDSDSAIQVLGLPGAWGVDTNGANLIPVGGQFSGAVDYIYPGQSVSFQASSNPVTPEELAAVAEWRFTGEGPYLSARWLVGPECDAHAPLVLTVMN